MNTDEHEKYEYARKRTRQKKRLYYHFIILLIGSLFLYIANKWLKYGEPTNWCIWAITAWTFIFIFHFINVYITDSFMDKNWEREQVNKLIALQDKKIEELSKDLENKK